jgi:archaellum biogenesis protein FlaJ (TadC family)
MPEEKSGFDDWYDKSAQSPSVRKYRHEAKYRMAFLAIIGLLLVGIVALLNLHGTIFFVVMGAGLAIANFLGIYVARRQWAKSEKSN